VLHSFETPTGYRFLLTTSRDAGDLRPVLADLYTNVFLPHALYNPLYELGTEVTCARFVAEVDALVSNLPCFRAP
jgi:Sybindin-like family